MSASSRSMSRGLPGVSGVWEVARLQFTIDVASIWEPRGFWWLAVEKLRLNRVSRSGRTTTLGFVVDRLLFRVIRPDLTGFNSIWGGWRGCCWWVCFFCLQFFLFSWLFCNWGCNWCTRLAYPWLLGLDKEIKIVSLIDILNRYSSMVTPGPNWGIWGCWLVCWAVCRRQLWSICWAVIKSKAGWFRLWPVTTGLCCKSCWAVCRPVVRAVCWFVCWAACWAEQSVDQFAEKFVKQFAELILKQIDSKSSLRSSWRFELWGAVHFAEMYSQLYVGQQSAENLVDIPVWNLRSMGHLAP